MKTNSSEYSRNNLNKTGQFFFNFGTFFLATALPISGIFFIVSIFISFLETKFLLLKDKWNLSILFIGGLFIFNSIRLNILNLESSTYIDKKIATLDLFNWIPLFILFISSQYYLKSKSQRYLFSRYLISGTIPVLISCILQFQFDIYGPFKTFYGLIVIFNKELLPTEGVSGLFSNANYTGMWLTISLPLLLLLFIKTKKFDFKKVILFIILSFTIYIIFLTLSRNALAGFLTTLLLIFGLKKILFFVFLIFLIYLSLDILEPFIKLNNINLFRESQIQYFISKLNPNNISTILEITRIKIWINTLKLIIQKPIFGFGAATFPIIFLNFSNLEIQHSHNIFLQLAFDYGIPLSILLTFFIISLFFRSLINIFQTKDFNDSFLLNKCWLASCLVAILNNLNDITYYDGKISILIWLFFAGLKCIFDETNQIKKKFSKLN